MEAIVTVGLPACGKTTFAAALAPRYLDLNLDAFRAQAVGDATDQDATRKAVWRRDRALERAARDGRDVVISDTHARRRNRTRLIRRLRELGYHVRLVFFDVGESTCLARNAARDRRVPEAVIAEMAASLRALPPRPDEADSFEVRGGEGDRLLGDQ